MADLRLFVAIELPANALESLNKLQRELQRDASLAPLRWVRPEGMHLTLKFLGAVPTRMQPDIEAGVARAAAGVGPIELRLGKLGMFGTKRAPRVLWVDLDGEVEGLGELQTRVEHEMAQLGFATENRRFSPHLTLARLPPEHASEAAEPLAEVVANHAPPRGSIAAKELALMKSDLRPGGAIYTRLFAATLNV